MVTGELLHDDWHCYIIDCNNITLDVKNPYINPSTCREMIHIRARGLLGTVLAGILVKSKWNDQLKCFKQASTIIINEDCTMTRIVKYSDTPAGFPKLQQARELARQQLPPITNAQRRRLSRLKGYAGYRMVDYLLANPGTRTDALSLAVAIRNPPDVAMKIRTQLNRVGLEINCDLMTTKNRYGHPIAIGVWFLSVSDHALWFGSVSANDES